MFTACSGTNALSLINLMGLTLRSYGYVCKAKNKATGLVRAVKTIAKALGLDSELVHETLADPLISSFETDTPMPNRMQVIPLSTGRRGR